MLNGAYPLGRLGSTKLPVRSGAETVPLSTSIVPVRKFAA